MAAPESSAFLQLTIESKEPITCTIMGLLRPVVVVEAVDAVQDGASQETVTRPEVVEAVADRESLTILTPEQAEQAEPLVLLMEQAAHIRAEPEVLAGKTVTVQAEQVLETTMENTPETEVMAAL
jgi:hypothetical protein